MFLLKKVFKSFLFSISDWVVVVSSYHSPSSTLAFCEKKILDYEAFSFSGNIVCSSAVVDFDLYQPLLGHKCCFQKQPSCLDFGLM
jgi:hypothetical protein